MREIREAAAELRLLTRGRASSQSQTGDSALVVRARQGDLAAFDDLYRRHRDQMYTLCLNISGDREQAEGLLQETFVRAWRGLRGFRGKSSFSTWLYRIGVNVCRGAARRRPPEVEVEAVTVDPDLATVGQVRETMGRLRPAHRVVLALRYNLSLSYDEIAELLNWSLPRVKVTIHRARAAFKDAYVRGEGER